MPKEERGMGLDGVGRGKIIPIEWLRTLAQGKTAGPTASSGQTPPGAADPAAPTAPADDPALLSEIKQGLADLPDVRQEKVDEAKLRISSGYYNRPEIRKEILRSVLQDFLPQTPDQEDPHGDAQS